MARARYSRYWIIVKYSIFEEFFLEHNHYGKQEAEGKCNLINRVAEAVIYIPACWSVSKQVSNGVTVPPGAMAASYGLVYIFKPLLEKEAQM